MHFCDQAGIPHSEFLAWDQRDQAKQLAFMLEKAERCARCGTADWEWNEDNRAYEPVERLCWGCYHKEGMRQDSENTAPGVTVTLVPAGRS